MRSMAILALVLASGCAATNRGGRPLFCDAACEARYAAQAEADRKAAAAAKAERERIAAEKAEEARQVAERQAVLAAEDARKERFCLSVLKGDPIALQVAAGKAGDEGTATRAACLAFLEEKEAKHQERLASERERAEAAQLRREEARRAEAQRQAQIWHNYEVERNARETRDAAVRAARAAEDAASAQRARSNRSTVTCTGSGNSVTCNSY